MQPVILTHKATKRSTIQCILKAEACLKPFLWNDSLSPAAQSESIGCPCVTLRP